MLVAMRPMQPLALSVMVLGAALLPRAARAELPPPGAAEIVVDLKDDATDQDEKAVEAELGGLHLRPNSPYAAAHDKVYVGDVSPEQLPDLLERLKSDPKVERAEPNYMMSIPDGEDADEDAALPSDEGRFPKDKGPNDPLWDKQWSFRMVGAPEAWKHADGKGVVVAVIDTGVAYEDYKQFRRVEDLAQTKFVPGYNFINDTEHANDDHGHGTHVAGTIAESTNNGVGVAGLAYGATIMPLKVLDRYGRGMTADIADAIRFAADEGAKVINLSLGGGMRSLVLESAVAYAHKKGVVVVCAAGNGSRGVVEYPAAHPGAFAVSSVGPDRTLAYYSSWGKQLALSAPGGDKNKGGDAGAILQNTIRPGEVGVTNAYLAFQGTSMATPHVAAAAALLFSAGVTANDQVEAILRKTAAQPNVTPAEAKAGWSDRYGAGILDAAAAVKAAANETHGVGHLALGLFTFLGLLLKVGRRHGMRLGLGSLAGVVVGSSGLFFLADLLAGVPGAGLLTQAMPNWDLVALGPKAYHTALWASAIPMIAIVALFLGSKRLGGLLAGLTAGWAAHLFLSAFVMPANVGMIPGDGGLFDRIWLIMNALVLVVLAGLLMVKKRD
jgi:serine protease